MTTAFDQLKEEIELHFADMSVSEGLSDSDMLLGKCLHFLQEIEGAENVPAGAVISEMEQLVTRTREFAAVASTYRNALCAGGLTLVEVNTLMLNFNHIYWESQFKK